MEKERTNLDENFCFKKMEELKSLIVQDEYYKAEYIYYRNKICEYNYSLVWYAAKQFNYVEFSDLIQSGYEGLILAAENYDLSKGTKFSNYAMNWIRKMMIEFIRFNSRRIYIPSYLLEYVRKVKKVYNDLSLKNGIPPTLAQLAKTLNVPVESIEEIIGLIKENVSIDDDSYKIECKVEDERLVENRAINKIMQEDVDYFLTFVLNEKDAFLIRLLFGIQCRENPNPLFAKKHDATELSEMFNVSHQAICRRRDRIFNRIKNMPQSQKLKDYL